MTLIGPSVVPGATAPSTSGGGTLQAMLVRMGVFSDTLLPPMFQSAVPDHNGFLRATITGPAWKVAGASVLELDGISLTPVPGTAPTVVLASIWVSDLTGANAIEVQQPFGTAMHDDGSSGSGELYSFVSGSWTTLSLVGTDLSVAFSGNILTINSAASGGGAPKVYGWTVVVSIKP